MKSVALTKIGSQRDRERKSSMSLKVKIPVTDQIKSLSLSGPPLPSQGPMVVEDSINVSVAITIL
jgi:hypothetical protein